MPTPDKIAVLIVNYNMPERTSALAEVIYHSKYPHDLYVIDNGSDIAKYSHFTNVWIDKNIQTTGGWLAGLKIAKDAALQSSTDYLAYMFLITSAEFVGNDDPLAPLAQLLLDDPLAVGVHPALTADSTTHWEHMKARGGPPRRTWFIDNIASMYRASWFDSIGGFDPALTYAWGIDLETCYKARVQGRSLYIHEGVQVKKVTDIGYTMGRMNMSADERQRLASENERAVLSAKYGADYYEHLTTWGIEEAWR
jgi:GT2 family glycosyltransferase